MIVVREEPHPNNSKPEYVMAHSMQMLALLVEGFGNKITAILIGARI